MEKPQQFMKTLMYSILMLLLIILPIKVVFAQDKIDLAIHFLTNENIADINFANSEALLNYVKEATDKCKNYLEKETASTDVLVSFTFRKHDVPLVKAFVKPPFDEKTATKIVAELQALAPVKTTLVDFSLLFVMKLNGGAADKKEFIPALALPQEEDLEKLKANTLSLQEQSALIRNWALNFALPVVKAYEQKVDTKFAGVKAVGDMLDKIDFSQPQNVEKWTDQNNDYWRASLEMNIGNQLIPLTKILLYVANHEFDKARNYLAIINAFSDEKTVSHYLITEIQIRLRLFYKNLEKVINEGIKFHDEKKYDEAITVYQAILQQYPHTAWTRYELYYSQNTQDIEKGKVTLDDRTNWYKAKPIIYGINPMYDMNIHANNGTDGYLQFRRQSIRSLFKDKATYKRDMIEYAHIALDLEVYGFAAQLYWQIFSATPKEENGELLYYFLYTLEKLGNKELKKNFKGDMDKEFKKIDKKRKKDMESSDIYKLFKDKK